MRISAFNWLLIAALGTVWGGAFYFSKVAVSDIPPLTLVLIRVGGGAAVLWLVIAAMRRSAPMTTAIFGRWLMMGLLANALPFALLFYGQRDIGAGLASIINGSTVLWAAIFAHILLADEKLTQLKTAGIVVGFAGIVIMIGPRALGGIGQNVIAQLLVVATAISYGFAAVYSRRFSKSDPMITAAGQLTGAAILIAPIALMVDQPWHMETPSSDSLWAVTGLVLVSTAFAYVLYFRIVAAVGAVNVSLCTFIVPVVALVLGTMLLNERLTMTQWIGMACILLGMALIDGRIVSQKSTKSLKAAS